MDTTTPKYARPTVNFERSPWAKYFLNYIPDDEGTQVKMEEEAKKLEDEVKKKLKKLQAKLADEKLELIRFIDTIERLGVAYRLKEDIEQAILIVHDHFQEADHEDYDLDLFHTSLLFRLSRQHGLYISCDIFTKFHDEDGIFKRSLASDVKGVLSLYEASFLGKHGEYVMDEARIFTTARLKAIAANSNHPLSSQASHALYQSLHRGMARQESRIFISFYQKDPAHDKTLLKFSKLDFNIVQNLHKKELRDLTRWWKDLGLIARIQVSYRDRIVETYFWAVGLYYEPEYSLGRKIFVQWFVFTTVIDDIYDAHGTLEELAILTEAVRRWDKSFTSKLPKYMRLCYEILLDIFEGYERDLAPLGRSQFVKYARNEMINLCQAYYQEAKWCNKKYTPTTLEEYLNKASLMSSGCYLITTLCCLPMKEANKEAFEWIYQKPLFVRDAGIVIRFVDDIASHGFEQERNHVASAVELYMKEHEVSEEAAVIELQKQVECCWKSMNEMMMMKHRLVVPRSLLTIVVNLCRLMDVIYAKGEDSYTFPNKSMKNNISLIFTDPIPLT